MRIHVLGVCGTFMGGVAQISSALGHQVEGSDDNSYEPMAGQLASAGVRCHEGYDASCDERSADLYIIGNVVRRGNPFFEDICRKRRSFISGPEWIARNFLRNNKKVVAVAGTHGKTTTTAMIVHILEKAGKSPGYLVGGVLANGSSAALGSGDVAVIEADEYDTAFFDKRPKFVHYWADVCVLNNIEFDHADIYPDLPAVMRQFALLPRSVNPGGSVIANWSDANVRSVLPEALWHGTVRINDNKGWSLDKDMLRTQDVDHEVRVGLPAGEHNRDNFLAAAAACSELGVMPQESIQAMEDFSLPMRRMQMIHEKGDVAVVDDFAHHPTSIRLAIDAARSMHEGKRLIVLFEPRSNTMRAGHWKGAIAASLKEADEVLVLAAGIEWDLDEALAPLGDKARTFADASGLSQAAIAAAAGGNALVLMLSNGDFSGLRTSLPKDLSAQVAG